MTTHKKFKRFIKRLKRLKLKHIPKALSKLISKNNLNSIYDFFDISKTQIKIIDSLRKKSEKRFKFLYELINLPYGDSMRLAKEKTGLSRTLNVIREKNGRYKLYLETKSKLEDNTKQVLPTVQGVEKKGKPVWRLGTNYTEEFNLTVTLCDDVENYKIKLKQIPRFTDVKVNSEITLNALKENDAYKNFKEEISYNHKIKDKKYVVKYTEGQPYVHNNKFKVNIFCKKAIGTLRDVIQGAINTDIQERLLLSEMLLKGLKAIHASKVVHQDIKPENILVFENKKGYLNLKIADFGLSSTHLYCDDLALSTPLYHSPEIALWTNIDNQTEYCFYFHKKSSNHFAYSNQWVYLSNLNWSESYFSPHYLNDCWSTGIVLFELYTMGQYPIKDMDKHDPLILSNPLLQGLLEVERSNRVTAKEALNIFNKNKQLIFTQLKQVHRDSEESESPQLCVSENDAIIKGIKNMQIDSYFMTKSAPSDFRRIG